MFESAFAGMAGVLCTTKGMHKELIALSLSFKVYSNIFLNI